ncbi:MAG: serine/threonine-protein kinase [Pseudomonadota bacterium]
MSEQPLVGPYRILRLINRGGQGSVYLGFDDRLRRRVAIKIYSLPEDKQARTDLLKEARLVAGMQSPRIVQVHDVVESRNHLAMVMEYVPGCDLEDLLSNTRLPLASMLVVCTDLAVALTTARQHRVVHGDLKAANVLISSDGRVKLSDFGIARYSRQIGAAGGSFESMSPEQYQGKVLSERSDLFSLGCLLFRMMTGKHPFYRDGRLDVRSLLAETSPSLMLSQQDHADWPEDLEKLVRSLLQKNPGDRPYSTRVVRQALRTVARSVPLAASSSLLQEAQPFFRLESPEDIPPNIPAELGSLGQYSSHASGREGRNSWYGAFRRWRWPAMCSILAASLAWGVASSLPQQITVHIDAPRLQVDESISLPHEFSASWLVDTVGDAVQERRGSVQITGPIGATPVTAFSSRLSQKTSQTPRESLTLGLRCDSSFCVLALSRELQGTQYYEQAILFPDMPVAQWRDVIRATTLALYR